MKTAATLCLLISLFVLPAKAQSLHAVENLHAKFLEFCSDHKEYTISYRGILSRSSSQDGMRWLTESPGVWRIKRSGKPEMLDLVLLPAEDKTSFVYSEGKDSLYFRAYLHEDPTKPISGKEFESYMGMTFLDFAKQLKKCPNRFQKTAEIYKDE
ncbi:hypothetical protein SAMN02745181_0404 [Rubritalea squalenifaciens DSM 18772]|uniref:Uncharacterized protein n=1 Tax=Rubritalea squalenifaciens DSM 18772 TaxID=1123071 RepID=A0A1M6C6R2_9BACT|nr:hypothetical protein [Rubritalea squalenifaciens]SHI56747.1 hypothetical protein SAMN02745181_0404 [Rubritalea squalenifaciens DSM 18772]